VNNYLSPFSEFTSLLKSLRTYIIYCSATLQPPSFHHRRVHEIASSFSRCCKGVLDDDDDPLVEIESVPSVMDGHRP
jgi:hypothetical protein